MGSFTLNEMVGVFVVGFILGVVFILLLIGDSQSSSRELPTRSMDHQINKKTITYNPISELGYLDFIEQVQIKQTETFQRTIEVTSTRSSLPSQVGPKNSRLLVLPFETIPHPVDFTQNRSKRTHFKTMDIEPLDETDILNHIDIEKYSRRR